MDTTLRLLCLLSPEAIRVHDGAVIHFQKGTPDMCEAEDRNKQALFVLENEWGCGRVDIGRMLSILRGNGCECEETPYARAG
jgi:hypothetical protein